MRVASAMLEADEVYCMNNKVGNVPVHTQLCGFLVNVGYFLVQRGFAASWQETLHEDSKFGEKEADST